MRNINEMSIEMNEKVQVRLTCVMCRSVSDVDHRAQITEVFFYRGGQNDVTITIY